MWKYNHKYYETSIYTELHYYDNNFTKKKLEIAGYFTAHWIPDIFICMTLAYLMNGHTQL